jgi:hypothetical protein
LKILCWSMYCHNRVVNTKYAMTTAKKCVLYCNCTGKRSTSSRVSVQSELRYNTPPTSTSTQPNNKPSESHVIIGRTLPPNSIDCCNPIVHIFCAGFSQSVSLRSLAMTDAQSMDHHAIYRRQICQYLSSTSLGGCDPILKEMESNLGQRALQYDNVALPSKGPYDELDMRVPPTLIHCHACGVWLRGSIRIQATQRGRTRRRRAARRLATLKREQQRRESKSQGVFRAGSTVSADDNKGLKRLFQVTDGTSKNVVVQTCDYCCAQRKMKGLPAKKAQTRKKSTPPSEIPKRDEIAGNPLMMPKNQQDAVSTNSQIPLFQSPLLAGGKKKKKKKPEPKSGLMNFLSSLNS